MAAISSEKCPNAKTTEVPRLHELAQTAPHKHCTKARKEANYQQLFKYKINKKYTPI
jgi:hypothetical protein